MERQRGAVDVQAEAVGQARFSRQPQAVRFEACLHLHVRRQVETVTLVRLRQVEPDGQTLARRKLLTEHLVPAAGNRQAVRLGQEGVRDADVHRPAG